MGAVKLGKNQFVLGWTEKEIAYLEKNLGYIPLEDMALKLHRTVAAIESKLEKMKISIQSIQRDKNSLSINQLSKILNVDSKVIKRWVTKYDFPAVELKLKKASRGHFYVSVEDFWEWADKNRTVVNWHKLERRALLPEPEWLDEVLKKPEIIKQKEWTKIEDAMIWSMFYYEGMLIKHIAKKRERTECSIEHRLKVLRENGFAKEMNFHSPKYFQTCDQPNREKKAIYTKWLAEEEEWIIYLYYIQGMSHQVIASLIEYRTEYSIEGKLNQLRRKGRISEELLVNRPKKIWTDEEIEEIKHRLNLAAQPYELELEK